MNFRLAEIGIVLMFMYIFLALVLRINFFSTALVFILLAVVGLIFYIFGRKTFLDHIRNRKMAFVSLAILSLIPIMEGIFFGIVVAAFEIERHKIPGYVYPLTWEESMYQILAFAYSVLKIISGVLLLLDGLRFRIDLFSLKQETGSASQTNYSKTLFTKYVERYPHNPEGVLEWHIRKKMKEGKTREQAIQELNIGDRSI